MTAERSPISIWRQDLNPALWVSRHSYATLPLNCKSNAIEIKPCILLHLTELWFLKGKSKGKLQNEENWFNLVLQSENNIFAFLHICTLVWKLQLTEEEKTFRGHFEPSKTYCQEVKKYQTILGAQ